MLTFYVGCCVRLRVAESVFISHSGLYIHSDDKALLLGANLIRLRTFPLIILNTNIDHLIRCLTMYFIFLFFYFFSLVSMSLDILNTILNNAASMGKMK